MRETLNRMWTSTREYISKMPRRNRIRLGILSAAVIIMAIIVVSVMSRTKWEPLRGTEDSIDPQRIPEILTQNRIPIKMDGDIVMVPQERLAEAVVYLQEANLLGISAFNDRWLSQASGFGTTNQQFKNLSDLQIGENLKTQMLQNPRFRNAFVIVNSGESSPFRIQTNTRKPTASVQIVTRDGSMLTDSEVIGIINSVIGAIPGIEEEDIKVIDGYYNYYTIGEEGPSIDEQIDIRISHKNRLEGLWKTQVEQLLSPVFGFNNVQVQPSVTLNWDKTDIEKIEFEPPVPGNEEGMMRTLEDIYRESRLWPDAQGIPGTDENGMGVGEYPFLDPDENTLYKEEITRINYDMNETRTLINVAEGQIEDCSITVLINSEYLGEGIEAPLYPEEMRAAVATATGIPADFVTVQFIPFPHKDTTIEDMKRAEEEREARARQERMVDLILTYGTILVLAVMVIMLVRSVVNTLRPPPEPEMALVAAGPEGVLDLLIAEEEAAAAAMQQEEVIPDEIELNAKSPSLEQIERFIDKDPEAVTQLLRNWLSED